MGGKKRDMLYQFLAENREKILAKTRKKTDVVSEDKPISVESERGLPQFYDYLTGELERAFKGLPKAAEKDEGPDTTAKHGRELKRLGYTVSQLVQGYGALSLAITEATLAAKTEISAAESKTLNLTLDLAIAEAVTGFARRVENTDCAKKIGVLSHELRNALAAASIAHSMHKKSGGGTRLDDLLEKNLARMRDILDRSVSEARILNESDVEFCPVNLLDIAEEVEATAVQEALGRGLTLEVEVGADLEIITDSHYLISALSNLVQNAIKYSQKDGTVWIRGRGDEKMLVLEVEDRCGGLPAGKAEELFQPFTQMTADRTGLGLGLAISRQAIARIGGELTVRDLPGTGCIFSISLPKQGEKAAVADREALAEATKP